MVDVLVIGAGMAGLAAAAALQEGGRSVRLLEARERIGGRAWTVEREGLPFDLGCHWFHSADRNPLVAVARHLGIEVEENEILWAQPWNRRKLGKRADDLTQAWERLEDAFDEVLAGKGDRPFAELLEETGTWAPFVAAAYSWSSGTLPETLSSRDLATGLDTHCNWRTPAGLGSVVARFGGPLPVTLDCPVRKIAVTAGGVRVESDRGSEEAKAVIVTVPTGVLAAGGIVFDPPLEAAKLQALADLPLGDNEKVFFRVVGQPFGNPFDFQANLFYDRVETAHYHIQEFARPTVEAYFGGPLARRLASEGEAALAAFAVEELVQEFGSDLAGKLTPVASTAWCRDPWLGGAYSYARPGASAARATLAAPHAGRVHFAGEATSRESFATLHGAYGSGRRAATEILTAKA